MQSIPTSAPFAKPKRRRPTAPSQNFGRPARDLFKWIRVCCEFGPPETLCRAILFRFALRMVKPNDKQPSVKKNEAWPSHSKTARDCAKSRRHVIGAINKLVALGWLNKRQTRSANGNRWPHNIYTAAYPPNFDEAAMGVDDDSEW